MVNNNSSSKSSTKARSVGSGQAVSMADLMAKTQTKFRSFKKGEVLEGVITKLTSSEILVDIGAKTEAVVLEKDKALLRNLLSKLKVGDTISVSILNPESDLGYPVVSLRRFMEDKVWVKIDKYLADRTQLDVLITGITKGGFLARTEDGISGFLPNSQTVFSVTGKDGTQIEGLIHVSEASWEKIDDLSKNFKVKDKLTAKVIEIDPKEKRLSLSLKRLTEDTFGDKIKDYPLDKKLSLRVKKVSDFGITLDLEEGLEGIIKKEKIPPGFSISAESEINVTVSGVDKKRRRIEFVPVLKAKPIGYR
ncbi:MAG: SSU ribosomal protein S1p RpsA [Candidatus Levybacteria bacterium GW2011_GWB1_41_21]|nr:MAG: SSU ribosomal protein S1p RpsA [Candidatus Levybacteria bacterium GW2011_GWB1_41_21]